VSAEDVRVLLPNNIEPAPVDAGVTAAGSKDGDLPKLKKPVSFFETGVVA
jgi:hypothetical protein